MNIKTPAYTPVEMGQLKLLDPPEGITMTRTKWGKSDVEITFEVDPAKVKTWYQRQFDCGLCRQAAQTHSVGMLARYCL